MNINVLLPFFIGMVILAATPGPGVITSMARAIADGFTASLYFIGGLVAGDIIFLLLALFGLSAIARLMGGFFLIIKVIGGLYLVYLGVKIYRNIHTLATVETKRGSNRLQTFTSGFLVTLGNPKPILFYASVLPTLIDFNNVKALDVLGMTMLIALVSFGVLGTYCYIASLSRKATMSSRWNRISHQVAGIVMIVVGVFVIVR